MTQSLKQITLGLLKAHNRFPHKRLGQNFLINPEILERIIAAAELNSEDYAVEIGTGLGVLTQKIAEKVKHLTTIEVDKELLNITKEILKNYSNIDYVPQSILEMDLASIISKSQCQNSNKSPIPNLQFPISNLKVLGNLPYYITSPILEKVLKMGPKPKLCVFTIQKEVAERICAKPGSKKYGSLSVFVQYYAKVELVSLIPKFAFHPQPNVSSAIIKLAPRQTNPYGVKDEKFFFDIIHKAFQQRRKKLSNSLKEFNLPNLEKFKDQRPEELSLEDFALICQR